MSYPWDKRVDFVVRHMYDIDNNGSLDNNDFACMALRATVVEGKGKVTPENLASYKKVMDNLWKEISDLADFDKDGKITTDEFKQAVQTSCVGKKYAEFPQAMKAFIDAYYKTVDVDGDNCVSRDEYRYSCITRIAVDDIKVVDDAFDQLLNDDDKKRGGISLQRFQELYASFLGDLNDKNSAITLFGPVQ
uniref:EF-hand domain-containing protein n=1 Tax=Corethrella appendiculata TaxID=1370023 RepID=U5EL01_9DIPT